MSRIYFRNSVMTDSGLVVVRGWYSKVAPFVYKQLIFKY